VSVHFRVLIDDIIGTYYRWAIGAGNHSDTFPGFDPRAEIIVVHQVDSIGATFGTE